MRRTTQEILADIEENVDWLQREQIGHGHGPDVAIGATHRIRALLAELRVSISLAPAEFPTKSVKEIVQQ
jgi:hypothetical protein